MVPDTTQLRALCLGGLDWDELLVLPHYPEQGELVHILERSSGVGGVGRCALALTGLGYSVTVTSHQGAGRSGILARHELESFGVTCNVQPITQERISTILVVNGERTILATPPAAGATRAAAPTEGMNLILCATSAADAFLEAIRRAVEGTTFSYDAGDRVDASRVQAAEAAHIVTGRPQFFAGIASNYEAGIAKLLQKGVQVVAATNGGGSVHVHTPEREFHVTVPKVNAKDTTGCGDVFHAVLAGRITEGWPVYEATLNATETATAHGSVLGNSELHKRAITRS